MRGRAGSSAESLRSRSAGSLCRQIALSQRAWRMPSIIDAWLSASDRITAFSSFEPSVPSAAQFET